MSRSKNARVPLTYRANRRPAFTLVEMLIAVAITLVMMAAVVTLFASLTESVRSRRAAQEISAQLRHVRNVLQQDLEGHTCPGVPWQRPESNVGYIELIEGMFRDSYPSQLTDGVPDSDVDGNPDIDGDGAKGTDELDPNLSLVPRANGGAVALIEKTTNTGIRSAVNGLGDYDDILMLTTRNEREPYVGRAPDYKPSSKGFTSIESPLAEVIWFAIENPRPEERARGFFGEPGMRTVYRRALLIAPWLDPYGAVNPDDRHPGVVQMLDSLKFSRTDCAEALAALIAFQDKYDLSVRLEWDGMAHNGNGQWKIVANTLGDLTKRENRFLHYQYNHPPMSLTAQRRYPWSIVSHGNYQNKTTIPVTFVSDPDFLNPVGTVAAHANLGRDLGPNNMGNPTIVNRQFVSSYTVEADSHNPTTGRKYASRPFAYLEADTSGDATPSAMLNDQGQVVRVVTGPVPLWGPRRGEDIMLTDALAFDLRVYDPGAPVYMDQATSDILAPGDPGWNIAANIAGPAANTGAVFVGQGAFVDLGYSSQGGLGIPAGASFIRPSFSSFVGVASRTSDYAIYDTWSLSYENNGIDENGNGWIDEGTDGVEYFFSLARPHGLFGPDDASERETQPPYTRPLRGIQAILRAYEPDSRQIRQVRVNQHLLGE